MGSDEDSNGFFETSRFPGQRKLKEAVATQAKKGLSKMGGVHKDSIAGLTTAIAEIPDGMANALLAGVNPVYGLYANMVGPFVGGVFSSTHLMTIVTTSAATLTVGQSIITLPMETRSGALFLTVILCGCFQIILGLLGAARLVRFVSYSVMTGFLSGIGMLLMLSQLPTVTGIAVNGGYNRVIQTLYLMGDLETINLHSLTLAALTLFLAIILPRTKIGSFGTLIAVLSPSVLAAILRLEDVKVVGDYGTIPFGIPLPQLPPFTEFLRVTPAALALAIVILIQGAGVSQGVPNPDGSKSNVSHDFFAQGAANIASGIFKGLPVGGSFSATTLTVVSGANSRLAPIASGIWILAIILVFADLMPAIVMPSLGAILILAGLRSMMSSEYRSIWDAGWPSRLAFLLTFLATLLVPIELAVAMGVMFSATLYVGHSASEVEVVELNRLNDGRIEEREAPRELEGQRVTVLEVHGSLFFASARTLEAHLPSPANSKNPAVVLRLRNHSAIGATLIEVLSIYSRKLDAVNGRLYITGVGPRVLNQLRNSNKLQIKGPVRVFEKEPIIGESTAKALAHAQVWLIRYSSKCSP